MAAIAVRLSKGCGKLLKHDLEECINTHREDSQQEHRQQGEFYPNAPVVRVQSIVTLTHKQTPTVRRWHNCSDRADL